MRASAWMTCCKCVSRPCVANYDIGAALVLQAGGCRRADLIPLRRLELFHTQLLWNQKLKWELTIIFQQMGLCKHVVVIFLNQSLHAQLAAFEHPQRLASTMQLGRSAATSCGTYFGSKHAPVCWNPQPRTLTLTWANILESAPSRQTFNGPAPANHEKSIIIDQMQ